MRVLLALLALSAALSAQEIDRIVAVVNRQPIVESEWEQQERFESLANEEPTKGFTHSREALDRVIDRRLILQQMESAHVPRSDAKAIAAQVTAFRTQLRLEDQTLWQQKLVSHGLLESDIADILGEQADVLRFIDVRFRMSVHVTPEDVRQYYQQSYLPELRRNDKNGVAQTLDRVRPQIQSILVQQRVNDLFATWLKTLRAQANVRLVYKDEAK
jgi:parvulin-like peptidyl-prolyl isomerase